MNIKRSIALQMARQWFWNSIRRKPISVSFEITHACTANCWHCNLGGPIQETRLGAVEYAAICRELDPIVSQISGGEPLFRDDVEDIIRAQARPGRLPFMVVVSNASRLTPEKLLSLKAAGMDQLSLSIDFPDDRHSEFRRIPGLFDRMNRVVPECVRLAEPGGVVLNNCITRWNFRDVPAIVDLAQRWGTSVNFSAFTPMRTSDTSGLVEDPAERRELYAMFETLVAMKRAGKPVYSSEGVLWKFYRFLCGEVIPDCRAGDRFVVINPDGRLTPCAMVMAYYTDQRAMLKSFTCKNTCTRCYISTRANTEKSMGTLLSDNFGNLGRVFFSARGAGRPLPPAPATLEEQAPTAVR